ncbi:hypothetical protein [Aquirufa rosea]|uniref:Glycosyltransferase RgtA/B/C/D-like domain-containing protein n=1 Tax=Aquirufa rosea TaxID=2509241 RepID=A0A4Q1BXL6_9BACT|nr:hypothetical protein [Aquirufa rosea]RXK47123.1 hypothetical protein ESB04_11020 [Aquirufa rosea]
MIPNIPHLIRQLNDLIARLTHNQKGVIVVCFALFIGFSILYFPQVFQKKIHTSWTNNERFMIDFVNRKIEHPFTPIIIQNSREHYAKREVRIAPYVIGKVFHLNAIRLFYLQVFLLPFFLVMFFNLVKKLSNGDSPLAFWATVCILFTYVGHSFVYDTLFYDSFAYVFLLIACLYYDRKWSIIPLVFAFFVDERSLFPALIFPLLYLFKSELYSGNVRSILNDFLWKNKSTHSLLLSYSLYIIIRYYLYKQFQLETPVGQQAAVQIGFAFLHGYKLPYALFSALKWANLLLLLTLIYLVKKKMWTVALYYFGIFLACFLVATAVDDVTRSLTYCFPLVFLFFQIIQYSKEQVMAVYLLGLIFLANFLTPTYTLLMHLLRISPLDWLF